MRTKDVIHELIDTIEDEEVLNAYLLLIKTLSNNDTGRLWNSLNEEQKDDVLKSYEESFVSNNLVAHEEIKKQHSKWLEK